LAVGRQGRRRFNKMWDGHTWLERIANLRLRQSGANPPPTLALKNFQLLDAQRKQQIFLILRILQAPQTLGICDASPEARERNG